MGEQKGGMCSKKCEQYIKCGLSNYFCGGRKKGAWVFILFIYLFVNYLLLLFTFEGGRGRGFYFLLIVIFYLFFIFKLLQGEGGMSFIFKFFVTFYYL